MDNTTTNEQVLNLDLSSTAKKKVVVNGNDDAAFYINTSDFGIYGRLQDGVKKLYDLLITMRERLKDVSESEDVDENNEEQTDAFDTKLTDVMKDTDAEMRSIVDGIFNAPVSDNCAPDGYMFDMFEGQLRFEYIISAITKLYENNINAEFYKIKSRINSKLPAYAKKK